MEIFRSWDKRATVRNRPRRLLVESEAKYFFPLSEQPVCFHPLVEALGEETRRFILIQSAYQFMRNILINEMHVVNATVTRMIQGPEAAIFSSEQHHALYTVLMDETYHAYVANDFVEQVRARTGVAPIRLAQESSLNRAIEKSRGDVPSRSEFDFDVIAVCIAENSITKELLTANRDPDVNSLFSEINADHLHDEARHSAIFFEILTHLWGTLSESAKNGLGPALPSFIREYLGRDVKVNNDRAILSQLPLSSDEIETILYDTHPDYSSVTFRQVNPIVDSVVAMLQRAGLFAHLPTARAFQSLGFLPKEIPKVPRPAPPDGATEYWAKVRTLVSEWRLDFLQGLASKKGAAASTLIESFPSELSVSAAAHLVLSYLHEVTQLDSLAVGLGATSAVPLVSRREDSEITFTEKLSLASRYADQFNGEEGPLDLPLRLQLGEEARVSVEKSEEIQLSLVKNLDGSLLAKATFDPDYYDARHVQDFLKNVSFFSRVAFENPGMDRRDLPLVHPGLRDRLLQNAKRGKREISESVVEGFRRRAREMPDAVAIVDGGMSTSYAELDRLSEVVAANFKRLGLKRGALIAILHEPSYRYLTVILGAMKAGVVFLPLSTEDPDERIRSAFDGFGVTFAVHGEGFRSVSTPKCRWVASVALLDPGFTAGATVDSETLYPGLAYVIGTSGTTGVPKGVMITERALSNFAESAANTFPIRRGDRVLQLCTYSFDPSLADICTSFISGATVCVRPDQLLDSSATFLTNCEQLGITTLNLPATLWAQIVQDAVDFGLPFPESIRTVVIGGEAAPPSALERWDKHFGRGRRLLNTYGPTETTIAVSACEMGKFSAIRHRGSVIGQTFTGAALLVLDTNLRLLPFGVIGELYIGGPGVSPGYLRQPELTAKAFLPQLESIEGPFYKTGDRVKWVESPVQNFDEQLVFVGRSDRQVKIRGFRIELGEIEQILNRHPGVASSRVLSIHQSLAAFVVSSVVSPVEVSELRNALADHLPRPLRPETLRIVDEWPTTRTGKIDDAALLALLAPPKAFEPRRQESASRLAEIWKELLNVREVSSDSHFFELGGHSLLAMRLLARIHAEFSVPITLRQVLETPRFADLAALLNLQRPDTPAPLSPAQSAIWVANSLHGEGIHYNIAYSVHLTEWVDVAALESAINYVVDRQAILRTVFERGEPTIQQRAIPYSIALKPESISLADYPDVANAEARTPFQLSEAPPFRVRYFQVDAAHSILLVHHHHLVHDGYSIGIFLKELQRAYASFRTGEVPALAKLERTYAEYASQSWDQKESETSLVYWRRHLAGYRPLHLPFRKASGRFHPAQGESRLLSIERDAFKKLRKLCVRENCTTFVGGLTVLKRQLRKYIGHDDVAVATMVSTRDSDRDANLIGVFLNAVILRTQVNVADSFTKTLHDVRRTVIEATEHRDTPLSQILRHLELARLPNDHALVDILVNYHYLPTEIPPLDPTVFKGTVEFIDNQTSKFGLSVDLYDSGTDLSVRFESCPSLFPAEAIELFAREFHAELLHCVT